MRGTWRLTSVAARHSTRIRKGQTMRTALSLAVLSALCLTAGAARSQAQGKADEDPLAADLKLLQGKWELVHGNEGKGAPTIRSVKEIKGNRETLRRYNLKSGKVTS